MNRENKGLGVKWLMFWVYFSLPVGAVLGIASFVMIIGSGNYDLLGFALIVISLSVLQIFIAYGLQKRLIWAWWLNWIPILMVGINIVVKQYVLMGSEAANLISLMGILFWLGVNYVYWDKRRFLFSEKKEEQLSTSKHGGNVAGDKLKDESVNGFVTDSIRVEYEDKVDLLKKMKKKGVIDQKHYEQKIDVLNKGYQKDMDDCLLNNSVVAENERVVRIFNARRVDVDKAFELGVFTVEEYERLLENLRLKILLMVQLRSFLDWNRFQYLFERLELNDLDDVEVADIQKLREDGKIITESTILKSIRTGMISAYSLKELEEIVLEGHQCDYVHIV